MIFGVFFSESSRMKRRGTSHFGSLARTHYTFQFICLMTACFTLTDTTHIKPITTNDIDRTSIEALASSSKDQLSDEKLNCPRHCVCDDVDKAGTQSVTCKHAGLKVIPLTSKKDIYSAPWRFADTLDLSDNEITSIQHNSDTSRDNVSLLEVLGSNLRTINLRGNRIAAIEENTFALNPNLKSLVLKENLLNHLSVDAFKELPNLTTLDLTSNYFTELPLATTKLARLQRLYISKNKIEVIPPSILQKCPELREFEVSGNVLKTIHPNAFIHLAKLEELVISEARDVKALPNLNGTLALKLLRFDRASIENIPTDLCHHCPNLKSLELKSNKIKAIPDLNGCKELRMLDLTRNQITSLLGVHPNGNTSENTSTSSTAFRGLSKLHDLHLGYNNISAIGVDIFKHLVNLKVLDLSHNEIHEIHDEAFAGLGQLEDLNLGVNTFSQFPSKGLKNLLHIKVQNNPALQEFPNSVRFPKIQSLVLSYAYHCCQFIPETYANFIPEYTDFENLQETIFFPGEGDFDHELWQHNMTNIWSNDGNKTNLNMWENLGTSDIGGFFGGGIGSGSDISSLMVATPPPGIQCMPAPGPFLPCNDLFDWWSLRCSVWIVFLLALLGNGCVVIVLVASRAKMDVPRFLVCNLAMADFCMGLYLGFLAIVDASTLGEFRKYAIHWQFSPGCQVAGFFGVLSSELSVFTLAVITLERNYAITHAMHLNKRLSLKHAAYIMCVGWSFAILMASLPLFGISGYWKYAVCLPFETGDPLSLGYVIFLMLINGVAFSILMGCYLKMYCAIRGSQAWNSNDSRIAKRMALLVFTDFICWAPIAFFALCACLGAPLISLEQAKVFTIFVLPLNSCCNPFLYAILTKQFKKDCVMICKTIEESRVTRGIGRCRHSSNFSNRQTPANTNSLNSGSGTHGSHAHSKGTICSCNAQGKGLLLGHGKASTQLARYWPFKKIKKFFRGYKEVGGGSRGESLLANSEYAKQIAEIQHKQRKTKRHASVSSNNFSSSRTDSWRHGHGLPGFQHLGAGHGQHYRHRRRNSWTVTRKPSQDSQLSSSRNDSSSINSNSTNTWRMSRSSVSSEMSQSLGRAGSNKNQAPGTDGTKFSALTNARARVINKANAELVGAAPSGMKSGGLPLNRALPLSRLASENASFMSVYGGEYGETGGKPKLTRQTAIMADGDSTCSGKSVTFKEPPGVGSTRRFIAATTELGQCPLHSKGIGGATPKEHRVYDQLVESNQEEEEEEDVEEESDMEASDAEYNDGEGIDGDFESDGIPLGTTFRTIANEQLNDRNITTSFSETHQKPRKAQRKHTSYLDGKNKLPSGGTHSASGGGRLREIGGAMVGFLPRKLSTISSSRDKDAARSAMTEAATIGQNVDETTPLRQEEGVESRATCSKDSQRLEEKDTSPQKQRDVEKGDITEAGDISHGVKDAMSSADSLKEAENENTVIEQKSTLVSDLNETSPSPSSSNEAQKTEMSSVRTETEKAKARFLESDI